MLGLKPWSRDAPPCRSPKKGGGFSPQDKRAAPGRRPTLGVRFTSAIDHTADIGLEEAPLNADPCSSACARCTTWRTPGGTPVGGATLSNAAGPWYCPARAVPHRTPCRRWIVDQLRRRMSITAPRSVVQPSPLRGGRMGFVARCPPGWPLTNCPPEQGGSSSTGMAGRRGEGGCTLCVPPLLGEWRSRPADCPQWLPAAVAGRSRRAPESRWKCRNRRPSQTALPPSFKRPTGG